MSVWWGGKLTLKKLNGTTLTPVVTVGYKRFELNDDPKLVDAGTVLTPGSRMAPTQVNNEWRLELPLDDALLPEALLLMAGGNILDFDWTINPSALIADQKTYSLVATTVGAGRRTSGTDDVNRFERSGAGGDLTAPTAP